MERDSIKLDYPMAVGEAKKQEFRHGGVLLQYRSKNGLTRLKSPYELGVADFASLGLENAQKLNSHLRETKYQKTIDMAERAAKLVEQAKTVHVDGFLFPTKEKPFTWELRQKIGKEIENQKRLLKKHGITEVKVGEEMEFALPEKPVEGFFKWRQVKRTILAGLRWELSKEEGPTKRKRLKEKISQVSKFNAREVLMYDLIELDPKTRGILEPLFGVSRDGDGYYDARGVLELKFKPTDPNQAIENRKTVLKTLFDKAFEYGLEFLDQGLPAFHINVSLWDKNGNLFADNHPSFNRKTKKIVEGVTRAFYDSMFVLMGKYEAKSGNLRKLKLDVNRLESLRFSSDRLEIRPSGTDGMQDPDMMLSVFLAGAIYGLENKWRNNFVSAKKVNSPTVHHSPSMGKVTSHVINNATIKGDGSLDVAMFYIREHDTILDYELGITDEEPVTNVPGFLRMFFSSDHLPYVEKFFKRTKYIKNKKGEYEIMFPETAPGKYTFYLPSLNMQYLPKELRVRMMNGEELPRSIMEQYTPVGMRFPRIGKFIDIDVKRLKKIIQPRGVKSKFVVRSYDYNKKASSVVPRNFTNEAWARYQRLKYSRTLAGTMSKDAKKEFKKAARKFVKNESVPKKEPVTRKSVASAFFHKIADRDYYHHKTPAWVLQYIKERGEVEGQDYLMSSLQVKFEMVKDGEAYGVFLKRVLYGINKRYVRKHKYVVDVKEHNNGYSDVTVSISPRLMKVLRKLVQK